MTTDAINYEAVLTDLEARKAQLEAAIQAIRSIANMGPTSALGNSASPTAHFSGSIPSDAFLGMSIAEATRKLLTLMRRRLGTPEIISFLVQGGLTAPAYNTAYAILRRRSSQVGDIININGEWGLKEWNPNYKSPAKASLKKQAKVDEPTELSKSSEQQEEISDEDIPF